MGLYRLVLLRMPASCFDAIGGMLVRLGVPYRSLPYSKIYHKGTRSLSGPLNLNTSFMARERPIGPNPNPKLDEKWMILRFQVTLWFASPRSTHAPLMYTHTNVAYMNTYIICILPPRYLDGVVWPVLSVSRI